MLPHALLYVAGSPSTAWNSIGPYADTPLYCTIGNHVPSVEIVVLPPQSHFITTESCCFVSSEIIFSKGTAILHLLQDV